VGLALLVGLAPGDLSVAVGPFRRVRSGGTGSGQPGGGSKPSLEMDHGARQGAGDSLDGLDFGNDKLPESINVCGLHSHNHVVRAGKDVGGANTGDTA